MQRDHCTVPVDVPVNVPVEVPVDLTYTCTRPMISEAQSRGISSSISSNKAVWLGWRILLVFGCDWTFPVPSKVQVRASWSPFRLLCFRTRPPRPCYLFILDDLLHWVETEFSVYTMFTINGGRSGVLLTWVKKWPHESKPFYPIFFSANTFVSFSLPLIPSSVFD